MWKTMFFGADFVKSCVPKHANAASDCFLAMDCLKKDNCVIKSQLRTSKIQTAGSPGADEKSADEGINSSARCSHIFGSRKKDGCIFCGNVFSFISRPHCHRQDAEHQPWMWDDSWIYAATGFQASEGFVVFQIVLQRESLFAEAACARCAESG